MYTATTEFQRFKSFAERWESVFHEVNWVKTAVQTLGLDYSLYFGASSAQQNAYQYETGAQPHLPHLDHDSDLSCHMQLRNDGYLIWSYAVANRQVSLYASRYGSTKSGKWPKSGVAKL